MNNSYDETKLMFVWSQKEIDGKTRMILTKEIGE